MESLRKDFRKELVNFSSEIQSAFSKVPRVQFLPDELKPFAGENHAIMVDEGSSVSQPTMIAFMLKALDLKPGMRVLEIGSGSGYVLALLCALGCFPVGVEMNASLANESMINLDQLNCKADVIVGNARDQCFKQTFDRILFSAALHEIPDWSFSWLSPGGFIVCPLGDSSEQELVTISPKETKRTGILCRFVPFVG